MARRLFRHRVRSASRRLTHLTGPLQFLGLLAGAAAASGIGLLSYELAIGDTATYGDTPMLHKIVGDRIFWFNALASLIFAYTSFEVIFRAHDNAFISLLPLDGALRWYDLAARTVMLHSPLLIPALGYAIGLFDTGDVDNALRTLVVCSVTLVAGLLGCGRLHLMAGRTVLREATPMQQYLASTVVDAEAALLLYAPAAGFAATLIGALLFDTFGRKLLETGQGVMTLIALGAGITAMSVVWLRQAGAEARRCLPLVISRFHEVDTPLPYRDDGVPEQTPGESWSRRLSTTSGAFFVRDLKQLSRRHRLDVVLLWGFILMMVPIASTERTDTHSLSNGVKDALTIFTAFVTLGWVSAFRRRGPELHCAYLSATLPIRSTLQAWLGQLLAEARRPTIAALIVGVTIAISGLLSGDVAVAAIWGAGSACLAALIALIALGLADAVAALGQRSIFYAATTWRAAMILLLFVADIFNLIL